MLYYTVCILQIKIQYNQHINKLTHNFIARLRLLMIAISHLLSAVANTPFTSTRLISTLLNSIVSAFVMVILKERVDDPADSQKEVLQSSATTTGRGMALLNTLISNIVLLPIIVLESSIAVHVPGSLFDSRLYFSSFPTPRICESIGRLIPTR
jgi:hypothetical protein